MLESQFGRLIIVSTIIDVLLMILWLFGRRRVGYRALLPSLGILKVGLIVAMDLTRFGAIHLIYLDLVVALPTVGLIVIATEARNHRQGRALRFSRRFRLMGWMSLGFFGIGWHATYYEPFNLQTESAQVRLAALRRGGSELRIAVLTDLQTNHVTDYEHMAVDRLMALHPDVILMPGDVFQGNVDAFDRELPALRGLLAKLDAPGGVYFVQGDVDGGHDQLHQLIKGTKIHLLINKFTSIEVKDRRLTIGGVELRYASDAANRVVNQMEADPATDDVRILVAHRPDVIFGLAEGSRIDLVVAGHTHGGQVVVPWFGPLLTLTQVPRKVAAGGLHALNKNQLYISRGVGLERGQAPRIRFLCPPELTLLTVGGTAGR